MLVNYIEKINLYTVNPYDKCSHACLYCISHSAGTSKPRFPKEIIEEELKKSIADINPEVELNIGGMADAYPPIEKDLGITRKVIKVLSALNRPFCINTKSDIVCRDIDILKNHKNHCDVYFSISSLNEAALRRLEPGAPPLHRRLAALKRLYEEGILVGVDASPWIPGISNAKALLEVLPKGVNVLFAPLDVGPLKGKHIPGLGFTQDEILKAYKNEQESIGVLDNVQWRFPY